jgi:hypothetical protein
MAKSTIEKSVGKVIILFMLAVLLGSISLRFWQHLLELPPRIPASSHYASLLAAMFDQMVPMAGIGFTLSMIILGVVLIIQHYLVTMYK